MSWASPFIQGSYGVVKLAYNENDNTYYVSIHFTPAPPRPPALTICPKQKPSFQNLVSWNIFFAVVSFYS